MITNLNEIDLPIPSKLTLLLSSFLLVSPFDEILPQETIDRNKLVTRTDAFNFVHWPKNEEEIIKGKEVAISVQNATISKLQEETNKSIQKIEEMNKSLSLSESEYQKEVNKLLMSIEGCSSSTPLSEIEKREQETLSIILNKLAKSTRFKEEKK